MKTIATTLALGLAGLVLLQQSPALAKYVHHKLKLDNRSRSFKVYLPKRYSEDSNLPVVVMLHGAGSNPFSINFASKMSKMANRRNFIVVFPTGTGNKLGLLKTWNAGINCGPAFKKGVDDVSFIGQLIDFVNNNYSTNPKKVFVAGMSNGGMMAYRVGSELSKKVAAIGVVEASMFCDKPKSGMPVNLVAFHSRNDSVIPLEGGTGVWYGYKFKSPSVKESIKYWVARNGCDESAHVAKEDGYTKYLYKNEENGSRVLFYLTDKGGHSWPGSAGIPPFLKPTKKISATEKMCEFFMEQK